jgi:O-acetyl-ADP-ribose deacetylase (regulator of RNase III)
VGEAKITQGYNLPAQWVIHTVVPIAAGISEQEKDLLAQCYQNSLKLAHQYSIRTVAFPALGTGSGKFSVLQAATIAIKEIKDFLNTHFSVEQVSIVCLDEQSYQEYMQVINDLIGST